MNFSTYQIKHYKGEPIMPVQDFIDITGVDIRKHKLFFRPEHFTPGVDWNGLGWDLKAQFEQEYGIKYDNEDDKETLFYMRKRGVLKALVILSEDGSLERAAKRKRSPVRQ